MDERLKAYAVAQGGVFTWADAQRYCVTPRDLARWVADGSAVRVRRNAYIVGEDWEAADRDGRDRLRVRAVVTSQPSWAASHQCALVVQSLPLHAINVHRFDVAAPVSRCREQALVRRHPNRDLPAPVLVDGCRTLPAAWAITQVAIRDGPVPALVALDRALHEQRVELSDIRAAAASLASHIEEARAVDRILALADPRCESVGETRTRLLLLDLGFTPESQVVIRDRTGAFVGRVDFLIEGRIVVEFDGAIKYEGDDRDDVLQRQQAREQRLVSLGYAVVRLEWADLDQPAVVLARIVEARRGLMAAS